MYGKCGKMYEMPHLMPGRVKGPRQSWNILISGYARHGHFNKAEEEIRSIARREDIRQSRPVNRSSTTSGNQEIEVNLNRDYWFKRKTEWAYDQCSLPY